MVRFNLAPNEANLFSGLLIGQFYRWLLWLVISVVYFVWFIGQSKDDETHDKAVNKRQVVMNVMGLVLVNITLITFVEMVIAEQPFSLNTLKETLVFFFFQKAPIYTLSYIALLALYQLLNLKDNLHVEIVALKDLNEKQQMSIENNHNEKANEDLAILSIKVGNSYKMIAVKDICWLEAYDYCVKIHTRDDQVFAMRNSLKALEKQLSSKHFLRIHRKSIVNMQKAKAVVFTPRPKVIINDDLMLEIAQSRIKDVKAYLQ